MTDLIISSVAQALQGCKGVVAVVLGGSRATGTASETSDIDIGVYYDREIDFSALNFAAKSLDDGHRDDLICPEGGWGPWVNCGGWLSVQGRHVDVILRDFSRVCAVLDSTENGEFSNNYQPGHPHAFQDVMYRGELACCKVLYARDENFAAQKKRAEAYPPLLKKALVDYFLFEAGFSCGFMENYAHTPDTYYLAGHAFRAVSALNQVLFAANETWLLNEKKAVARAEGFKIRAAGYKERVEAVFSAVHADSADAARMMRALCDDVQKAVAF